MRAKYNTTEVARSAILGLLSLYGLTLYAQGKLGLYIHPRYVVFTAVANTVGLVLAAAGIMVGLRGRRRAHRQVRPKLTRSSFATSALLLVVVVGFCLPAQPLSTAAARSQQLNQSELAHNSAPKNKCVDVAKYPPATIQVWSDILTACPDPARYEGSGVTVTGLVAESTPGSPSPDSFEVVRLVISCCVIDARPKWLVVQQPGWAESYRPGSWVRIKGQFQRAGGTGGLVIVPSTIEQVPQPSKPYEYFQALRFH